MMFELQDAPAKHECAGLGRRSWFARVRSISLPRWQAAHGRSLCARFGFARRRASRRPIAAARCAGPRRGAAERRDRLSLCADFAAHRGPRRAVIEPTAARQWSRPTAR